MTSTVNISRKRGDTFIEEITVINQKTLAIQDITGFSFILSVATTPDPVSAVYLFQVTGIIIDAANGTVGFTLSTSDANNVGDYFYDIQMLDGTTRTTVAEGEWEMTQDITKD